MGFRVRRLAVLVAGLCVASGLAACSSGAGTSSVAGASGKPANTHIVVGSSETLFNASLYLAAQNGTFAKDGLSVTPQPVTSGQAAVPELLHGQLQFTAIDPLAAIVAISQGVSLEIVAPSGEYVSDPARNSTGLIVRSNSGLTSGAAFDGKTIAVNAIGGIAQLSVETSVDLAGGKSNTVKFVEVPIPQMVAAVQSGRVDGAVVGEPFLLQAKQAGLQNGLTVTTAIAGVPTALYVTTKAYAASHPSIVAAFAKGLYAANDALASNPAEIRVVGKTSTTTSAAVLSQIILPVFTGQRLTVALLNKLEALMIKYKLLPKTVNLEPNTFTQAS